MLSKQLILHSVGAFGATVLMAWLQIRTYGVLCILALLFWIYKTRCPSMKLIVPDNVTLRCQSIYNSFAKLRTDKPGTFCTITSLILIIFAIFGHIVSGEWIVLFGLMLAGLISTRHNFKLVKDDTIDSNTNRWGGSIDNDNDVDEFLPVVNETAQLVLNRAGEEAIVPSSMQQNGDDDNDDNISEPEVPADLLPETLPEGDEHLISSDSDDDIMISSDTREGISNNRKAEKLDEIKFNSKHFNGADSSSSDDDSITKGLSFHDPQITYVDGAISIAPKTKSGSGTSSDVAATSAAIPNLSNLVQWGVNNIIKSAVQQHIQQTIAGTFSSSSSDNKVNLVEDDEDTDPSDEEYDEYEIINPEDLNS